ncbi:MAG: hypothetical protein CW691_03685 [Candidatus Bathyarchaeum sp.]|nr:MAG: hypothetical protein CW691_03685 [Candidatus Bathyarchaeum sp.]
MIVSMLVTPMGIRAFLRSFKRITLVLWIYFVLIVWQFNVCDLGILIDKLANPNPNLNKKVRFLFCA